MSKKPKANKTPEQAGEPASPEQEQDEFQAFEKAGTEVEVDDDKPERRRPGRPKKQTPIAQIAAALKAIPNKGEGLTKDKWDQVAAAIFAATDGSAKGFELLDDWSIWWPECDEKTTRARWQELHDAPPDRSTVNTLFSLADEATPGWRVINEATTLTDFYAYLPTHTYMCLPTRELWPATSVNGALGSGSAAWLDQNRAAQQMTWAPKKPNIILDLIFKDGGWIERPGWAVLNQYLPPNVQPGDASMATPWRELLYKVFGTEAEHTELWFAQRVQNPDVKINHALVLGGAPGIGKDTIFAPVRHAVGFWNFVDISPQEMQGRFNSFKRAVILRVNELRDLGSEQNRYSFYEHSKTLIAAPPETLMINEKFIPEIAIPNVVGLAYTTNSHNGLYLPANDRRHFVAWSELTENDFPDKYWPQMWKWYETGGHGHVAAYLRQLDITKFDPGAVPRRTEAFWRIVQDNIPAEHSELADVLDAMDQPAATTIADVVEAAKKREMFPQITYWLTDPKNRRAVPHRFEACGYVSVPNPLAKDGLWVVRGTRMVVYARANLSGAERQKAVADLVRGRSLEQPRVERKESVEELIRSWSER